MRACCASAAAVVLLVAILDPPREEAVEAIRIAHRAGITVKMITGNGHTHVDDYQRVVQVQAVLWQVAG